MVLAEYPAECIDLIVTSPPYADKRKGGIPLKNYVPTLLSMSEQFIRVLKPIGSFVLNIKEGALNGERQTYVMELVLALKQQGWLWTEEYIWHKSNSVPGKWPNRFRDNWEHCYHFTKQRKFYMDQDAVMVPIGEWAGPRLRNLSEKDKRRDDSAVGSGFGKNISNWLDRKKAYPTNVIYLATECGNKNHSAAFPLELPIWFIKLFTKPGDVVLDPFVGSGTTAVAAEQLGRHYLGIDISIDNCEIAEARLKASQQKARVRKAKPQQPGLF